MGAPAFLRAQRPQALSGVMAGDVIPGAAMVWSRADRPSRLVVTWKTSERGPEHRIVGPHCISATDYTGRVELTGLPAGQTILYSVQFQSLNNERTLSEPLSGTFRTPPASVGDISFLWSGDLVGQGWGINPDRGGMQIFDAMRKLEPGFFIHSGDVIYADGPVRPEVKLVDGSIWRNLVTEEKSKPAETLDEYRGAYRYNLLDRPFRDFIASVAQVWQWDDHEVLNNWSPSKNINADRNYAEKNVPVLVARGTRAFLEYAPVRPSASETERIYRKIPYGPLLDVFVVDLRSYRGPNTSNLQDREGPETAWLGQEQFGWLKRGLTESKAVWKAIACDMPVGLLISDGKDERGQARWEGSSNGDGAALGRELEMASLLRHIKQANLRNVVWFTADVHYTAAHSYDPRRAQFTDFLPFWEFVSGPLNAGTFGPNQLDNTFGPEVVFQKAPPAGQSNLPPSAGYQFFGQVQIDARTKAMTVTLRDAAGAALHRQVIAAQAR